MARPLRLHIPGMLYHVISRGDNKRSIFIDQHDYTRFLRLLSKTLERFKVRCFAYCLLPNHIHLLLQPDEVPLARLMQQLNSAYCQSFNRRHDRVGHVLQGRYKAPLVDSDAYFLCLLRYIVRNPVAAGYVDDPEDWEWSSYKAAAGLVEAPAYLDVARVWKALDACDPIIARERLKTFVSTAVDDDVPRTMFLIGSEAFATQCAVRLRPYRDTEDIVYAERFAARPSLSRLLQDADGVENLGEAARRAFCDHAYTLREIGTHIDRPVATVWRWIQRAERESSEQSQLLGSESDHDEKIEI